MKNTEINKKQDTKHELYTVLSVAYYDILTSFCSDDGLREWMMKPFKIGSKLHSTNSYFLATIDLDKVQINDDVQEFDKKKLNGILPNGTNKNIIINIAQIKEVFTKAPQEYCYDIKGIDIECTECGGSGNVEWEYEHYTKTDDCPVCDGYGKTSLEKQIKTGETKIQDHLNVDIGNSRFYVSRIQKLIDVADKLDEKEIKLIYQENSNSGSMFKIKDLEILLMPCMKTDTQIVIASYT